MKTKEEFMNACREIMQGKDPYHRAKIERFRRWLKKRSEKNAKSKRK